MFFFALKYDAKTVQIRLKMLRDLIKDALRCNFTQIVPMTFNVNFQQHGNIFSYMCYSVIQRGASKIKRKAFQLTPMIVLSH